MPLDERLGATDLVPADPGLPSPAEALLPAGPPAEAPRAGTGRVLLAIAPVLVFAALAVLFLLGLGTDPSTLPSALIGRPAPPTRLEPVPGLVRAGRLVPGLATADLQGGVSVVNVFQSSCGPCRDEAPVLARLASTLAARGGVVPARLVGIDYKDDPDNARRYLGEFGNPYTAVGADPAGRTAIDWGVYGVPETFVVAPDGTIAFKLVGPVDEEALASTLLPQVEAAAHRPGTPAPAPATP